MLWMFQVGESSFGLEDVSFKTGGNPGIMEDLVG